MRFTFLERPLRRITTATCAAVLALVPLLAADYATDPATGLLAVPVAHAQPTATPVYEPGPLTDGAPAPQPAAESWILADLDSGEVFVSHRPDRPHAPASTIKLLTGLALVGVLDDRGAKHEATYEDMLVDGTKVGLLQKNDYSIDDLFHAMLMSSANDAAHALADAAGGQEKAVALMNAKAEDLQLTGTHAANTSGLDAEGQVTTVEDLLRIGQAVLDDDYLMEVLSTTEYDFPGAVNPDTDEKLPGYPIQNHTRVVGNVEGGLGLKNGFTRAAGGSFIAVAERDGRTLASAVLGASSQTRQSAVDLIDWGFAQSSPEVVDTISLHTLAEAEETAAALTREEAAQRETSAVEESPAGAETQASREPLPQILLVSGLVLAGGTAGAAWFIRTRRNRGGAGSGVRTR